MFGHVAWFQLNNSQIWKCSQNKAAARLLMQSRKLSTNMSQNQQPDSEAKLWLSECGLVSLLLLLGVFPTWLRELQPRPLLAPGFGFGSRTGLCRLQHEEETHHQHLKRLHPSCCLEGRSKDGRHLSDWSALMWRDRWKKDRLSLSHHSLDFSSLEGKKQEIEEVSDGHRFK